MNQKNNIEALKNEFSNLLKSKNSIEEIFKSIAEIIENLSRLYKEIIKNNNNNKLLIICLDTFHFQKVLLRTENKGLNDYYKIISNRIYCDFYKLSTNIISYIKTLKKKKNSKLETNILKKIDDFNKYPCYDDLDIQKLYSFTEVKELYNDIIETLALLKLYVEENKNNLNNYQKQCEIGLNLDNFIYSFASNINEIENKLNLFCNYTLFFIQSHNKNYYKFLTRVMVTYRHITEDIQLDKSIIHQPSSIDITITKHEQEIENQIQNQIQKTINKTNSLISSIDTQPNKSLIPNIEQSKVPQRKKHVIPEREKPVVPEREKHEIPKKIQSVLLKKNLDYDTLFMAPAGFSPKEETNIKLNINELNNDDKLDDNKSCDNKLDDNKSCDNKSCVSNESDEFINGIDSD